LRRWKGQKFPKQVFTADAAKAMVNATAPMVVLVNRGTSGPAELVAAALQDDKRGELVGEKTFGEGSMQKTFDLPDGGAVILSIAKYASPSGKKFEDDAVTPGTLVASNLLDDLTNGGGDDDSVPAVTCAQTAKAPAEKKPAEPDDQLTKALDLLKAKAA
jgi:carboxyl-terminal processing protease